MKKVLVIITTSFIKTGGLTSVMMNYYKAMNKDGLQIDFASSNEIENDLEDEINLHGSKHFKLPKRKNLIKYEIKLFYLCKDYDVLHVHGNSTTTTLELFVAYLRKVPKRIVHIHSSQCTYMRLHRFLKPLFQKLYTDSIACSNMAGNWVFKKPFMKLNNAIDIDKFLYKKDIRIKIRNNLKINENDYVIGNVAKLNKAKNHEFLLDIFYEIKKKKKNAKLLLIGDGELRQNIEMKIKELSLENDVVMLGMRYDVNELMQAMDVFVFPSIYEGLGMVLIEAQANSLPCYVSSNVPKESNITTLIQYIDLLESAKTWSDIIIKGKSRENIIIEKNVIKNEMCRFGYDIYQEANKLREIYMNGKDDGR